MAGHNKWSKVKRLKGALDAKRGTLFSRLSREITVAARNGGGDLATNFRLRGAVAAARAQNMPTDTIERAVKKGTGELASQALEELVYEGYAPGGVAVLIETMTENKNRTAADLRLIFTKHHGSLATSGSVAYLFSKKGQIAIPAATIGEEALFEKALEAGADEVEMEGDEHVVTTAPERLYAVGEALKAAGCEVASMKFIYVPATHVAVSDPATAKQILSLYDALDDCEDVQAIHANADIDEQFI